MKKVANPFFPVGVSRSTKRWSPISRVFSMEEEGISNCWMMKVRINKAPTNTAAIPAMNSGQVSLGRSTSFLLVIPISAFIATFVPCALLHTFERPAPPGLVEEMDDLVEQESDTVRHVHFVILFPRSNE